MKDTHWTGYNPRFTEDPKPHESPSPHPFTSIKQQLKNSYMIRNMLEKDFQPLSEGHIAGILPIVVPERQYLRNQRSDLK